MRRSKQPPVKEAAREGKVPEKLVSGDDTKREGERSQPSYFKKTLGTETGKSAKKRQPPTRSDNQKHRSGDAKDTVQQELRRRGSLGIRAHRRREFIVTLGKIRGGSGGTKKAKKMPADTDRGKTKRIREGGNMAGKNLQRTVRKGGELKRNRDRGGTDRG